MIPVKGEHHALEEEYEDAEHIIPAKKEHGDVHHLPKEHWTPDFHAREVDDSESPVRHHYTHADAIPLDAHDYLDEDVAHADFGLKPKQFNKDDHRINIP